MAVASAEISAAASKPARRWGYGKPPHPEILAVFEENRGRFRSALGEIERHRDVLHRISWEPDPGNQHNPFWNNPFFSTLDAAALVGFILSRRPKRLVEIGSGNSTRFSRYAITAGGLSTTLTSIDPQPRAEIDAICDRVVRSKLQDCDPGVFSTLEAGDILFFDGSHYIDSDSDVVVFFLEILPRLKPGVLVQIHDIFWPDDYPPQWDWHLNEQFMLGVALLAKPLPFELVLANNFASEDDELGGIFARICKGHDGQPDLPVRNPTASELVGASFWLETTRR